MDNMDSMDGRLSGMGVSAVFAVNADGLKMGELREENG
jgi:hypothetical protein